jgi:hypothetical protein
MPPLPFDITTIIFIALAIFVLWRVPSSLRKEQQSRGASKLSPREILRNSVLWFVIFFAVLTFVTYCQHRGYS